MPSSSPDTTKTRRTALILIAAGMATLQMGASGCYERVVQAKGLGSSSYEVEKEEDNPGQIRQFFGDQPDNRPITPRPGKKKR